MKVLKFGGTSVGSAEKIKNLATIINNDDKKIVVLSAISGTTNSLETISSLLLKGQKDEAIVKLELLKKEYIRLVSELFITDESLLKGNADEYYIRENLKRELAKHTGQTIFITQGYICRDAYGEIDNLKRGGSDYSASLIGAQLNVDEIQIWTDIDGFHNNDPRYVKKTFPINELSFDEAAELAYFGAKILHPSSVLPAKVENIPVRLKNTMQPNDKGTLITEKLTEGEIKAVAAKDGIMAIKIKSGRMLLAHGFLRKVFEVFERYETPIDMITTSEIAVSVTIDNPKHINEIKTELESYSTVEIDDNQTIICVVGNLIAEGKGVALKVIQSLENIALRMISYGGSKHNISVLVNSDDKIEALNELNDKLFN
ncbi:MAG: aspartate kinase [Bacteroidetes bacterium 4572_117]|nr:MAG: aspartate kinase [Bacteroidetes bacterium 4572_117]